MYIYIFIYVYVYVYILHMYAWVCGQCARACWSGWILWPLSQLCECPLASSMTLGACGVSSPTTTTRASWCDRTNVFPEFSWSFCGSPQLQPALAGQPLPAHMHHSINLATLQAIHKHAVMDTEQILTGHVRNLRIFLMLLLPSTLKWFPVFKIHPRLRQCVLFRFPSSFSVCCRE